MMILKRTDHICLKVIEMEKCKICGKETDIVFNMDLNPIPICNSCANSITIQHVMSLVRNNEPIKFDTIKETIRKTIENYPVEFFMEAETEKDIDELKKDIADLILASLGGGDEK